MRNGVKLKRNEKSEHNKETKGIEFFKTSKIKFRLSRLKYSVKCGVSVLNFR